MADFIKVNVHKGGEVYLSKYGISYFAKNPSDSFTLIKFTGERDEEPNSLQVKETPEDIIEAFEG